MKSKEYKEVTMHIVEIKQHDVICTSQDGSAGIQDYTVQDDLDW